MAAKDAVVVVDKNTGLPIMVVVPDFDSQLSDPAFNPPNSMQIPVSISAYQALDNAGVAAIVADATAKFKAKP